MRPTLQLRPKNDPRRAADREAVRMAQNRLTLLGFPTDSDGVFGARTDRSVRQFQAFAGLPVDGVVGPSTWDRLYAVEREHVEAERSCNIDRLAASRRKVASFRQLREDVARMTHEIESTRNFQELVLVGILSAMAVESLCAAFVGIVGEATGPVGKLVSGLYAAARVPLQAWSASNSGEELEVQGAFDLAAATTRTVAGYGELRKRSWGMTASGIDFLVKQQKGGGELRRDLDNLEHPKPTDTALDRLATRAAVAKDFVTPATDVAQTSLEYLGKKGAALGVGVGAAALEAGVDLLRTYAAFDKRATAIAVDRVSFERQRADLTAQLDKLDRRIAQLESEIAACRPGDVATGR